MSALVIYAIRHPNDGSWLCGTEWVGDFADARTYTTIGPARARVTAMSTPGGFVPELVELTCVPRVIQEVERVAKVKRAKQRSDAERERARREWELRLAQETYDAASKRLETLRGSQ